MNKVVHSIPNWLCDNLQAPDINLRAVLSSWNEEFRCGVLRTSTVCLEKTARLCGVAQTKI